MSTLLSNEIRKKSNQEEQEELSLLVTGRKEKSELVKDVSLLSQEGH